MTAPSKLAPSEAVRALATVLRDEFGTGTNDDQHPEQFFGEAKALLAAIAAQGLVLVPVEQWLPIETAPKDRFVLLFCPRDDSTWFASWQTDEWYGVDEEGLTRRSLLHSDALSHWMPLPNPPAAVKPPAEET